MHALELQTAFFRHLKEKLPNHLSLVDEVAALLNISNDSAYRRIRGDKTLAFDEIQVLADHYGVSLDRFLGLRTDAFLFSGNLINREKFEMNDYLERMANQLAYFANAEKKQMYYFNRDIPLFYNFMFPELAAFKCYFWSRYNLNSPQYNRGQFLIEDFVNIFNKTGKKIVDLYLQIPSTEIWNLDCINTTIRQIDYYRETKIFKSHEDVHTLYNCLDKLVDHIEGQVELGVKFPYGRPKEQANVKYKIYVNEFVLGDNTVIMVLDGQKFVFMNHSIINYFMTRDEKFTNYVYDTLQVLLKKSTLISETGEKERQLFFDTLRHRIYEKRKLV